MTKIHRCKEKSTTQRSIYTQFRVWTILIIEDCDCKMYIAVSLQEYHDGYH